MLELNAYDIEELVDCMHDKFIWNSIYNDLCKLIVTLILCDEESLMKQYWIENKYLLSADAILIAVFIDSVWR